MTAEPSSGQNFAHIDKILANWRQGDCVLGSQWFVYRISPDWPVTATSQSAVSQDATAELPEQEVAGLVVVTQTCDIVRGCTERPYIEVCPLVAVDDQKLEDIEKGRRPSYVHIPMLMRQKLVADLDRTMTVEKPVLAKWERVPGWNSDEEARSFARALARKRARFAFPDAFTEYVDPLRKRLSKKHDKGTPEGDALRALREIRVQASPSWDSPSVALTFWFIRLDDDFEPQGRDWPSWLKSWLDLMPKSDKFEVYGQVSTLEGLTAADYVSSDALDLDHLSSRIVKNG